MGGETPASRRCAPQAADESAAMGGEEHQQPPTSNEPRSTRSAHKGSEEEEDHGVQVAGTVQCSSIARFIPSCGLHVCAQGMYQNGSLG
jgi:hypothetical protein